MKIFSVVAALFLSCYLGFILPEHHHEDGQDHPDCVVCVAQNQLSEVATVFCFAVFTVGKAYTSAYSAQSILPALRL
jgi:hypothetical protein